MTSEGPDRPAPGDESDDQDNLTFHSADVPDREAPDDDDQGDDDDPNPHSADMPHSGDVEDGD